MRNPVGRGQLNAAGLAAEPVEGFPHGTNDDVRLVAGYLVRPFAGDIDGKPGVSDPGEEIIVETESQREGVVARAEVCRSGRYSDVYLSGAKRRPAAGRGGSGYCHVTPAPAGRRRRAPPPARGLGLAQRRTP